MRIEHVALYANDMERMRDFYIKYFKAQTGEKYHNFRSGFSSYFLTFDDGSHLEIMQRPEMQDEQKVEYRTGYHHIAIEVGDRKDVDDMTKKLQEDGYQIKSGARTTGDLCYASVIFDEEGNEIELIAKREVGK